ncbi:MAG: PilZ domain-containing protein [Candidatus Sulfotelmatobacter sp.]
MDASISTARQTRAQHRHQLRTLTYVTFDQSNGGVIRNLTHEGIGAQVVAAVRPRQQVQLRFELRYPRLRVETRGEVVWATFSGQCGIRFIDLPQRTSRLIKEWIFGNLLEEISLHSQAAETIFADSAGPELVGPALVQSSPKSAAGVEEDDGLLLSAAPLKVIEIPTRREYVKPAYTSLKPPEHSNEEQGKLDWLSQPLSGRSLAWAVHALVVLAGMLLFTLVFLSVTGEAPRWPFATAAGALLLVVGLYWMFFRVFGGSSLGDRLSRLTGSGEEENEDVKAARFR